MCCTHTASERHERTNCARDQKKKKRKEKSERREEIVCIERSVNVLRSKHPNQNIFTRSYKCIQIAGSVCEV